MTKTEPRGAGAHGYSADTNIRSESGPPSGRSRADERKPAKKGHALLGGKRPRNSGGR